LAQRSAMAAHESAEKIEASIRNSRLGAVSLERVKESLGLIETKIGKTDVLVAEITLAAREQAQGIEHVSIAIEQMNKVAQDAAESASQIAHAAGQTHDQSKQVEDLVEQGIQVVGFKVLRREQSVSETPPVALSRSQGMVRTVSHEAKSKPKLSGPTQQADRHFKDF
jgi:methyl-accepting chemotaxis protein